MILTLQDHYVDLYWPIIQLQVQEEAQTGSHRLCYLQLLVWVSSSLTGVNDAIDQQPRQRWGGRICAALCAQNICSVDGIREKANKRERTATKAQRCRAKQPQGQRTQQSTCVRSERPPAKQSSCTSLSEKRLMQADMLETSEMFSMNSVWSRDNYMSYWSRPSGSISAVCQLSVLCWC